MPSSSVQMRLQFSAPAQPVELTLTLLGQVVLVDFPAESEPAVRAHLAAAGVPATPEASGGLRFPVTSLHLISQLAADVGLVVDDELRPLVKLMRNPPPAGQQVTIDVDPVGDLRVRWFDGDEIHDVALLRTAVSAFLAADLPFTASPRAWDVVRSLSDVPTTAGRCAQNLDGFVEVSALRPQLVERAPIPALFRLDETRFGVPSAFASSLSADAGFVWDHPFRDPGVPHLVAGDLPELSSHVQVEAGELATQLHRVGAAVLDWPSGLGRRMAVLAALSMLEATPTLVVCEPSGLWLWRRHAALFGMSCSLRSRDAQIRLVTYRDLARGVALPNPAALVFDELAPHNALACARLAGIADAFRVALVSAWPSQPSAQMELMSVLRPVEFRSDVPVEVRYPLRSTERLAEHVSVYRRSAPAADVVSMRMRRSSVVSVAANELQRIALAEVEDRFDTDHDTDAGVLLSEALEVVSRGTDSVMSAKLATALQLVSETAERARVCVTVRSPASADMFAAMCRPRRAQRWLPGAGAPDGPLVVWAGFPLPDMSGFDEVVVVDYPRSFADIDAAVGDASSPDGPGRVRVVHLTDSPDDRMAVLAVMRAEGLPSPLANPDGSWSDAEADYIFGS